MLYNDFIFEEGDKVFKILIFLTLTFSALLSQSFTDYQVLMYEDKSNSLTFEDIQNRNDFTPASNNISTGYSKSNFWLKFEIKNSLSEDKSYFIKFTENFLHEVECYVLSSDGKYLKYRDGVGYFKTGEKNIANKPNYEVKLKREESKTIYIRFFGRYPNYFSFNIFDEKGLSESILKHDVLYSLYIGAATALLLYNLFIFLFNREKVYLYYVFYVASFLIWQLQLNEYLFFSTYRSSWSYYAAGVFIPFWIAFVMLFTREILEVQYFSKKLDTIVKYLVYIYFLLAFSSLFFLHTSYIILNALASFAFPFLLYVGYKSYKNGNKVALFFIVGQISFLSMSTLFSLMADGYIEYSLLTRHGIVVGSLIEMVLFSIALGYRLKILRDKEHDLLQNLELKVKERTAQQQNILDVTMEAIGIYENGILIDVNHAALEMFGYKNEEEILGKNPLLFISSNSHELVRKNIERNYLKAYEVTALRGDGTEFPALVKGSSLKIQERVLRVVSVLDYTSIKANERELIIAKDEAQEATRIKAHFLANVTHEIRTPMNGIIGLSHILKKTELQPKQLEQVTKIDTAAKNLLNIINDVLDFSKIEAGKLEMNYVSFDINILIENVKHLLDYKAQEKMLKFTLLHVEKQQYFYGDELRLSQVLINLLNNAIKFTNKGEVKLIVEYLEDDVVRFRVVDTGIGISQKEQAKLFKSFSQADNTTTRKYGGTGLGLSISKELVELMGGKIWIESREGEGSEFIFEVNLPLRDRSSINPKSSSKISYKSLKPTEGLRVSSDSKPEALHVELEELFGELYNALQTKRPLKCKPIVEEIDKYRLPDAKEDLFRRVKIFLKEYNFKEAIEILRVDNV